MGRTCDVCKERPTAGILHHGRWQYESSVCEPDSQVAGNEKLRDETQKEHEPVPAIAVSVV